MEVVRKELKLAQLVDETLKLTSCPYKFRRRFKSVSKKLKWLSPDLKIIVRPEL